MEVQPELYDKNPGYLPLDVFWYLFVAIDCIDHQRTDDLGYQHCRVQQALFWRISPRTFFRGADIFRSEQQCQQYRRFGLGED